MVNDSHVQQTNSYTFFTPRQFIIPTNAAKIQHLKLYGAKHQITYDRGPLWIKKLSRRAGKIVSNLQEFDVVNHPQPPSDQKSKLPDIGTHERIWALHQTRNVRQNCSLLLVLPIHQLLSICEAFGKWDYLFYNENMTAFNQFGLCLLQWETMTAFRLG